MKKRLFLAAAAVISLCGAGMAQARDLNWAVSIGDPMVGAVISNGPVYGYAPRVYAPPPVVVVPAPRVVYERPYAYAPVPYGYATYGYVPYRQGRADHGRWSHRYEERNRHGWRDHDRRDDRGGRDDYRDDDRDERRHRH